MSTPAQENKAVGLIQSLSGGGAERQFAFLLERRVIAKIFTLEKGSDYEISGEIVSLDTDHKKINRAMRFLMIPLYAKTFASHLSAGRPVISYGEKNNLINIAAKLFVRHPAIVGVVTNPGKAYRGVKYPVGVLAKFLYRHADIVMTNSVGAKKFIEENWRINPEKVVAIHNGIDAARTSSESLKSVDASHERLFGSGPVAIVVGRFEKPKGHEYAIHAFKNVVEKIPDAKLLFLGQGILQEKLKALVREFGLESAVHFLGFQKNPFSYVSRADILILPSLWEGMPNVVLESIASGTPVVAVDCDFGPREIFGIDLSRKIEKPHFFEYGALVPAIDPSDSGPQEDMLAETIVSMFKNPDVKKHLGDNSKKLLDRFSPDAHVSAWRELFKNIPEERRNPSVGAYFQVYKQPKSVIAAVRSFRAVYSDASLVMISDAGYDYENLARKLDASYEYQNQIGDGVIGMVSESPDPFVKWIGRIVSACRTMSEDFVILFEEDVRILSSIKNLNFDLNGIDTGVGLGTEMTRALKARGAKIPARCDDFFYGGFGGTVLRRRFVLEHFSSSDAIRKILIELKPFQKYSDPNLAGKYSSDYWLTVLVLWFGGTVGDYPGLCETSYLSYPLRRFVLKNISVLHFDKSGHDKKIGEEEIRLLGGNSWKDLAEYDSQVLKASATPSKTSSKRSFLFRIVPFIRKRWKGFVRSYACYE